MHILGKIEKLVLDIDEQRNTTATPKHFLLILSKLTLHKICIDLSQPIGLGFCEVQAKATGLPRPKE